jgi:hypothetical protein
LWIRIYNKIHIIRVGAKEKVIKNNFENVFLRAGDGFKIQEIEFHCKRNKKNTFELRELEFISFRRIIIHGRCIIDACFTPQNKITHITHNLESFKILSYKYLFFMLNHFWNK